ncbi:MAG: RNA polymerase sigma factor [Solirubrobacteraceae bacterium]
MAQKVATVMTAFTDSAARRSDPAGTHRFAYPVVREIASRRSSSAHGDQPSGADEADRELVVLVLGARRGNDVAWERLIDRFDPMLRKVARSFRLSSADIDDVVQETWVLLHSHIGGLREPAAVAGWLATTVRRRSLRLLQSQAREQLVDNPDLGATDEHSPETAVLESERHEAFMRAVEALPERQRRVVTLLVTQPKLDYQRLGELLEMPVGSIGPTRARGLARLERDHELRHLCAVSA